MQRRNHLVVEKLNTESPVGFEPTTCSKANLARETVQVLRQDARPFETEIPRFSTIPAAPPLSFIPARAGQRSLATFVFDPVSIDTLKAKGIAFEPVYANH
jgi:hypothetical protein